MYMDEGCDLILQIPRFSCKGHPMLGVPTFPSLSNIGQRENNKGEWVEKEYREK